MSTGPTDDKRLYDSRRQGIASRVINERRRCKGDRLRERLRPLVARYLREVCSHHRCRNVQSSEPIVERLVGCREREVIPLLRDVELDVISAPGGQSNGLPKHDG